MQEQHCIEQCSCEILSPLECHQQIDYRVQVEEHEECPASLSHVDSTVQIRDDRSQMMLHAPQANEVHGKKDIRHSSDQDHGQLWYQQQVFVQHKKKDCTL